MENNLKNLLKSHADQRLPHALLLCGEHALAQLETIQKWAQTLLCRDRNPDQSQACGRCKSCQLYLAGTHPDYCEIYPESTSDRQSKALKIDQVRALSERLALKSQFQGLKIALIYPADRLNRNAANSLLKTLEEPPENSLLLLLTSYSNRLPATVRSRCQKLVFNSPAQAELEKQLTQQYSDEDITKLIAAANGSLSEAHHLHEHQLLAIRDASFKLVADLGTRHGDVSHIAKLIIDKEVSERFVIWLSSWVEDMIRIKMSVEARYLRNQDFSQELRVLSGVIQLNKVVEFYADTLQARQLLLSSANLQLLIESVLLSWATLFRENA